MAATAITRTSLGIVYSFFGQSLNYPITYFPSIVEPSPVSVLDTRTFYHFPIFPELQLESILFSFSCNLKKRFATLQISFFYSTMEDTSNFVVFVTSHL